MCGCTCLYFCLPFAIHVAIKCPPIVTIYFSSCCYFSVPFTYNITINSSPTITFCLCTYPNFSCHTFYKTARMVVGYVCNQAPLCDCQGCVGKHAGTIARGTRTACFDNEFRIGVVLSGVSLLGVETIFISSPQTDKDGQRISTELGR